MDGVAGSYGHQARTSAGSKEEHGLLRVILPGLSGRIFYTYVRGSYNTKSGHNYKSKLIRGDPIGDTCTTTTSDSTSTSTQEEIMDTYSCVPICTGGSMRGVCGSGSTNG